MQAVTQAAILPRQAPPTFEELYRQLCRLPPHMRGEILHGKLIAMPRPAIRHANASGFLGNSLFGPFHRRSGGSSGPGGWWILSEPELHLEIPGETAVLVPDLAGWKRERLPKLPDTAHLTLAPDWVCEILSPSTARFDRKSKADVYRYVGVTWFWLVDPKAHTLEAYRREGEFWMQIGVWEENDKVRVPPFEAVELEMERWWEDIEGEEEEEKKG